MEVKESFNSIPIESSLEDQFDGLMDLLQTLFSNSCVIEVLAGYLRNDSGINNCSCCCEEGLTSSLNGL